MTLLLGADPELFVHDGTRFVSALGLVPGTKEKPFPVNFGAVQVDGMAAEFNVNPSANYDDFCVNVQQVMMSLREMLPRHFDLKIVPVAEFSEEYMKSMPEEAIRLGCDPDFNAYTSQVNPRPDQHPTIRTGAGHWHLGWTADADINDPEHRNACEAVIKQLDFYAGLHSVIHDQDGLLRKQMYGMAGAYRPKKYGVEYRVLSNYWLKNMDHMRTLFYNIRHGFEELTERGNYLPKRYGDVCQEIINTNDKDRAISLCNEIGITY